MKIFKNLFGNKNSNNNFKEAIETKIKESNKEIAIFQEKMRNEIIKDLKEIEKNSEKNFIKHSNETIARINKILRFFENQKNEVIEKHNKKTVDMLLESLKKDSINSIKNILGLYQENNLYIIKNSEEENHKNIYNEVLETYNNVLEKIQNS